MNTNKRNYELLDRFSEEEINIVCQNSDLRLFFEPLQEKRYTNEMRKIRGKGPLVMQTVLPVTAFRLYKKGEEPFRNAVLTQLERFQEEFVQVLSNMNPSVSLDEIRGYNTKSIAEFYFLFSQAKDISAISLELFFIYLKLQDIMFSDMERQNIQMEIENIQKIKLMEVEYEDKIKNALREQEESLSADFERRNGELQKKLDEEERLYQENYKQLIEAQSLIEKYENLTREDRKKMEEKWLSEYEIELEAKREEDEAQREKALEIAEREHQILVCSLEERAEEKKNELERDYYERQRVATANLTASLSGLKSEVEEITNQKKDLDIQIKNLEKTRMELRDSIHKLEEAERKYIKSFEQRIITAFTNNTDIVVLPSKEIIENTELGEPIGSVNDLFCDFKANIYLCFDDETDVAGAVLSALLNGMGIVASTTVCNKLSYALAALLDMSTPVVIEVGNGDNNLKAIANVINETKSQVVCLKGVLDNFDENLFVRICEICREKRLFFSISDLDNLKMLSKAVMNHALVIDAESKLHFDEKDYVLKSECDLHELAANLNLPKTQIYKDTFKRLVTNKYIKQSTALEYSYVVQTYGIITEGKQLGDIIQKSIIYACDFTEADEELEEILKRCGITISYE